MCQILRKPHGYRRGRGTQPVKHFWTGAALIVLKYMVRLAVAETLVVLREEYAGTTSRVFLVFAPDVLNQVNQQTKTWLFYKTF